ncbi:MAG: c-type cytochrome [Chloroflexota bacterium]
MIDSIIIPSSVHLTIGILVLLTNAFVLIVSGWLTFKKASPNWLAHTTFILFQLVLMVQTLIGIKLLDQGLGILQLYIHYIGGLAPFLFCLLFYWLPPAKNGGRQSRRMLIVAFLALLFTVQTFTIGRIYVVGGSGQAEHSEETQGGTAVGDVEIGEELYTTCAGCHGADGVGMEGLGVALAGNEFVRTQSDDELVAYIIAGRTANDPDNRSGLVMPAWGGNPSLTEEDLVDIVAYLRTLDGNDN